MNLLSFCDLIGCITTWCTFLYVGISTPLMLQPYFWKSGRMTLTLLKMGTWKSTRTPKTLKLDCKGQNTLHWSVFYIIEKLSKFRCRKWAHMNHLDICSVSYVKKKGRESNWQFDFRPLKFGIRLDLGVCRWSATHVRKLSTRATSFLQTSSELEVWTKSYDPAKWRESKSG